MCFIPKALLRASSQITKFIIYLSDIYEVIIQSPCLLPLLGRLLASKLTVLLRGFGNCLTPKFVLSPSKHKTFVWLYAMLDQRRSRWADIAQMSYKYLAFAGQEDFLSNIVHLSDVGSMLGQRRRRWPNIKTALDQCLVWVVSCNQFSGYINAVNLYSIGYCWPTLDRPRQARFEAEWFFKPLNEKTCTSSTIAEDLSTMDGSEVSG